MVKRIPWSEYYSKSEANKRSAHEAYLMLSGKAFVTKEQLLWYIERLSKSSNTVSTLVQRCRDLEEDYDCLESKYNDVIDKYNNLVKNYNIKLDEVDGLKSQLEVKDGVIENLSGGFHKSG